MAPVGALVVPVSADISGFKSGLKQAQSQLKSFAKEAKGIGKSLGQLEGLGAGGLAGTLLGGGVGGFLGQLADQTFGITEAIKGLVDIDIKGAFIQLRDAGRGITEGGRAWAQEMEAYSDTGEMGPLLKGHQQLKQSLEIENVLLREGADAAEKLKLKFSEMPAILAENVMQWQKANKELKAAKAFQDAQVAKQEALAKDVKRLQLDVERAGMNPIDRQVLELQEKGLAGPGVANVRALLERKAEQQRLADMVPGIVAGFLPGGGNLGDMFGKALVDSPALAGLLKGSSEEASSLAKLRRDMRLTGDPWKDFKRVHELVLEEDKRIRKAVENPPIKQVQM